MFETNFKIIQHLFVTSFLTQTLVGVFVNLAQKRHTYVTSGNGSLAVDGDVMSGWSTEPRRMEDGWFVVDLKKLYRIHYTFIYKMCEDCDKSKKDGFLVGLSNIFTPDDYPPIRGRYKLCGKGWVEPRWVESSTFDNKNVALVSRIDCESKSHSTRYVIVQKEMERDVLAFSEVEVYADVASRHVNIAFGKPAYMGSSSSLLFWRSPSCVDEDATTTCRSRHSDSWFIIDLITEFKVERAHYQPEIGDNDWKVSRCIVGLSKHFMPKEKPPRRGKYDLCGSCPEENKENKQVVIECADTRDSHRYVILQQHTPALKNFVFADVSVFGITKMAKEMIGCFKLDELSAGYMLHYVEDCIIYCREIETLYSALQNDHCHCLTTLPKSPPSPLHSCNLPCPRDKAFCGGTMRFHSVYRNYPESMAERMLLEKTKILRSKKLNLTMWVTVVLLSFLALLAVIFIGVRLYLKNKKRLTDLNDGFNGSTTSIQTNMTL